MAPKYFPHIYQVQFIFQDVTLEFNIVEPMFLSSGEC